MSIKDVVISKANRAGLILKKHSPAILTGVAIVSGIAATATAIHSTLNVDKVIVEHNIRSQKIEKNFQIAKDPDSDFDYSEEAYKHDIVATKAWTVMSIGELYLPTFAFTTIAVACTLSAHHILSKRNAALASTVSILAGKFMDYRSRVVEEYGADVDRKFYNGIETIEETKSDGTVEEHKEIDNHVPGFSRCFDEYSIYWDRENPGMNVAHIRATLVNLNTQLAAKGHVFLNDAYRALGMEDTPAGSVMGWVYDKDTVIDFGVNVGTNNDDPWDFVSDSPWDGKTGLWLNFNVDPEPIYNRI